MLVKNVVTLEHPVFGLIVYEWCKEYKNVMTANNGAMARANNYIKQNDNASIKSVASSRKEV